jgi:hypothetical protein
LHTSIGKAIHYLLTRHVFERTFLGALVILLALVVGTVSRRGPRKNLPDTTIHCYVVVRNPNGQVVLAWRTHPERNYCPQADADGKVTDPVSGDAFSFSPASGNTLTFFNSNAGAREEGQANEQGFEVR